MKKYEALIAVLVGYVTVAVGAVMEFGGYGLIASGILLLATLLFVDVEEKK